MKNNMTILKERKRPQRHSCYVTLLSDIIDADPSSYEEVAKNKGKESISSRIRMSRMWYRDLNGRTQCFPYGSTRSTMQYMTTSWDTRKYLQNEASHRKKAQTMKRHLQPLEVKMHEKQTHVCKLKKALYKLRRNPWDNT